ncbi:MAG: hypothetical protein WEF50_09490 [Myxococcota bacterium]
MRWGNRRIGFLAVCLAAALGLNDPPSRQESQPMTTSQLAQLIRGIDPAAAQEGDSWRFAVDGIPVRVVADPVHDRMRILAPVAEAKALSQADLARLMQANFDTALDARYAIARGVVWAAFIHPLSPLTEVEFLSGIRQTLSLVRTYGTTFSSGALSFGGGDSEEVAP